jgi:hypothetical protein
MSPQQLEMSSTPKKLENKGLLGMSPKCGDLCVTNFKLKRQQKKRTPKMLLDFGQENLTKSVVGEREMERKRFKNVISDQKKNLFLKSFQFYLNLSDRR